MKDKETVIPIRIFTNEKQKIKVTTDSVSRIDRKEDYSKVFHEEIEMKLFYEGTSTLLIGNKTVITEPSDVVFINPYEFHSTIDYGQEKGKYHLVMVGLDFFSSQSGELFDLRRIFLHEKTAVQTLIRGDARIVRIVSDIVYEVSEKPPMYENAVHALVLELFTLLLRTYRDMAKTELPADGKMRGYEIVFPAIEKIRQDYAAKLSVDELAKLCNVSKFHFCRVFKSVTGQTVLNYQTEYRLRIADILIEKSEKSMADIARICGFDDVCYFSRCYKKHKGVSPTTKRAILSK